MQIPDQCCLIKTLQPALSLINGRLHLSDSYVAAAARTRFLELLDATPSEAVACQATRQLSARMTRLSAHPHNRRQIDTCQQAHTDHRVCVGVSTAVYCNALA
eukprot:17102-Heterococcus_DN1.PRE.1